MDEERGLDLAHGLVDLHAAPVGVDAPALARGIGRPDEADVLPDRGRGPEAAGDRLADELAVGEVDHGHAVVDLLAGRQPGEVELGSEIGVLEGRGTAQRPGVGEALGRCPLDHHPRRPVGPRPEDRPVAGQIPGLHAVGQGRPHALAGDHGWSGRLRERARRQQRARDESAAGLRRTTQERAPAEGEDRPDPRHGALPEMRSPVDER